MQNLKINSQAIRIGKRFESPGYYLWVDILFQGDTPDEKTNQLWAYNYAPQLKWNQHVNERKAIF